MRSASAAFSTFWIAALLVLAPGASRALEFPYGVASGEVTAESAVLWTRTDGPARLRLEVERLGSGPGARGLAAGRGQPGQRRAPGRRLLRFARAGAERDFTVHVQVGGLHPDSTYRYRFVGPGAASDVGTFRTGPRRQQTRSLRFAFSGDSDGTLVDGKPFYNEFESLRAALDEGLDFFIYHGDIIYADSGLRPGAIRAMTLDEFRDVYKVHLGYANLRALLAGTSTYVTWDDHEVRNDYDGQTVDKELYRVARQAFHEYLPALDADLPEDPVCAGPPRFRVHHWGRAADLILLDVRSCRSNHVLHPCFVDSAPTLPPEQRVALDMRPGPPPGCLEAIHDPSRTFLGPVQKELLKKALRESTATFKFVASGLPIQQYWALPYDRWESYAVERAEILRFIGDNEIENVIFLATDRHASWANEVFVDRFSEPEPVAMEFVTGPIAFFTLGEALRLSPFPGPASFEGFNHLFDLAGVDCRQLDSFSYAVVEVDATAGTAEVAFRDGQGQPVLDADTGLPCGGTVRARPEGRRRSRR